MCVIKLELPPRSKSLSFFQLFLFPFHKVIFNFFLLSYSSLMKVPPRDIHIRQSQLVEWMFLLFPVGFLFWALRS